MVDEFAGCILTGAEGEDADDCTTHAHEGDNPIDMFGNDLSKMDSFGTPRKLCELCGGPTPSTSVPARLCDRCWELKWRVEADPELTRKILTGLNHD